MWLYLSRSWIYRTDSSGRTLRLESQTTEENSPNSVSNSVLREVSRRTSLPTSNFRIVESQRRNWSNGCLGLSSPGIACTEAIVPGWRIVVANGQQRWVYRTNESGSLVKLDTEGSNISDLPASVVEAVLREASQYLNLPVSQLQIVDTEAKTWPNQCLGITKDPRLLCGPVYQQGIPGWRVVVAGGGQRLVYRSNESGSRVILDEAASNIGDAGTIKPIRISASELPPPLATNVVFRAINNGGMTGRAYQTTLLNNGRVIRELINRDGTSSQQQSTNISLEQLREFQSLLERQQFSQFNLLSYDLLKGAADNSTVTLSSRSVTTRYDPGQARLPKRLNQVIQAWNGITKRL